MSRARAPDEATKGILQSQRTQALDLTDTEEEEINGVRAGSRDRVPQQGWFRRPHDQGPGSRQAGTRSRASFSSIPIPVVLFGKLFRGFVLKFPRVFVYKAAQAIRRARFKSIRFWFP